MAALFGLGLWPVPSSAAGSKTPKRRAADAGAVVTFVGFRQDQSGTATIYADLTRTVSVAQEKTNGSELRYRIQNAKVVLRNNTNPLLAQHFGSVVESARLIPEKDAVVLSIKLRRKVEPRQRIVDHAGGACTVVIEIPGAAPAQGGQ